MVIQDAVVYFGLAGHVYLASQIACSHPSIQMLCQQVKTNSWNWMNSWPPRPTPATVFLGGALYVVVNTATAPTKPELTFRFHPFKMQHLHEFGLHIAPHVTKDIKPLVHQSYF